MARAATRAVAIAKANAKLQTEPVRLAPVPAYGEVSWNSPIQKNAFEVPIEEKVDLLLAVNAAALAAGARFVNSQLSSVNEQKYFASTDGDLHRPGRPPDLADLHGDRHRPGDRQVPDPQRDARRRSEWAGSTSGRHRRAIPAPPRCTASATTWSRTPPWRRARRGRSSPPSSVEAGQIRPGARAHPPLPHHPRVGRPPAGARPRARATRPTYAGTSFATLDKWKTKAFRYGNPLVNFVADRTQPGSLARVGYDDEGVKTKSGTWCRTASWSTTRPSATRRTSWARSRSRTAAATPTPGTRCSSSACPTSRCRPARPSSRQAELIAGVDKGILIYGRGSYSIDQQRYNFQFGGQLFYEIRERQGGRPAERRRLPGQHPGVLELGVGAICDQRDYRLFGSFCDGKGQPGQASAVSHGSATTRFSMSMSSIRAGAWVGVRKADSGTAGSGKPSQPAIRHRYPLIRYPTPADFHMPLNEAFFLALEAIRTSKLRSFFTLLGIIVSVGFLVAVVAIIQGMNAYVRENIARRDDRHQRLPGPPLAHRPRASWTTTSPRDAASGRSSRQEDAEVVRTRCPTREAVVAAVGLAHADRRTSTYRNRTVGTVLVFGVTPPFQIVQDYQFAAGEPLTEPDVDERRLVAVLG